MVSENFEKVVSLVALQDKTGQAPLAETQCFAEKNYLLGKLNVFVDILSGMTLPIKFHLCLPYMGWDADHCFEVARDLPVTRATAV